MEEYNQIDQLKATIKELKSEIENVNNKSIELIIQEMIDETILSLDLPDQGKIESIVYNEVEDQLDDAKDDIVNKTIDKIVSRLEY
jgi:predicted thioredoxin/glutaredoxin